MSTPLDIVNYVNEFLRLMALYEPSRLFTAVECAVSRLVQQRDRQTLKNLIKDICVVAYRSLIQLQTPTHLLRHSPLVCVSSAQLRG